MKSDQGLILALLLLAVAFGAQAQTVRLTNGEFPPYLTEEREGFGLASRIVSEAFAESGYKVEYGFFPWKRAYVLAEVGDWDGTVVWSWSAERAQDFVYSDPVVATKEVFFHLRSREFSWQEYADLKDLRIGATIGYFYGEAFKQAEDSGLIQVQRIATDYHNLRKLANNRIDLSLVELNVGLALLREQLPQYRDLIVANSREPSRVTTLHLLISKQKEGAEKLLADFNRGLLILRQNGRITALYEEADLEPHLPQ